MREDSQTRAGKATDMHWHDGSTCHGSPTLEACARYAIQSGWQGRVLERLDVYADGTPVKCYTLIAGHFDHWARYGDYVASVELTVVRK